MNDEIIIDCPKCNVRISTKSKGWVLEPEVGDFTHAIFDYVYTLSERYDTFMKRKRMNKSPQPTPVSDTPAADASTPPPSAAELWRSAEER